jgi:hypothetical protein
MAAAAAAAVQEEEDGSSADSFAPIPETHQSVLSDEDADDERTKAMQQAHDRAATSGRASPAAVTVKRKTVAGDMSRPTPPKKKAVAAVKRKTAVGVDPGTPPKKKAKKAPAAAAAPSSSSKPPKSKRSRFADDEAEDADGADGDGDDDDEDGDGEDDSGFVVGSDDECGEEISDAMAARQRREIMQRNEREAAESARRGLERQQRLLIRSGACAPDPLTETGRLEFESQIKANADLISGAFVGKVVEPALKKGGGAMNILTLRALFGAVSRFNEKVTMAVYEACAAEISKK